VARAWYIPAYLRNAEARHSPFMLSMIAWVLLLLLAVWGVVRLFALQPW
jgi:flagellar biogenesis protein FliO